MRAGGRSTNVQWNEPASSRATEPRCSSVPRRLAGCVRRGLAGAPGLGRSLDAPSLPAMRTRRASSGLPAGLAAGVSTFPRVWLCAQNTALIPAHADTGHPCIRAASGQAQRFRASACISVLRLASVCYSVRRRASRVLQSDPADQRTRVAPAALSAIAVSQRRQPALGPSTLGVCDWRLASGVLFGANPKHPHARPTRCWRHVRSRLTRPLPSLLCLPRTLARHETQSDPPPRTGHRQ